jgi:hypothetical protein
MNPRLIKCDPNSSSAQFLFSFFQRLQGQQRFTLMLSNMSFFVKSINAILMLISLYTEWEMCPFCDKRRHALRNVHLLYLPNRRPAIRTRISLSSKKQACLLFTLHWASSAAQWCGRVSFFQIRDDRLGARLQSVPPIWVSYIVTALEWSHQLALLCTTPFGRSCGASAPPYSPMPLV